MAFEIVVPRLGWSMDEGVFVEWLKHDGEQVSEGDPLFTLEGEKAVQDIESIDSGILRIPSDGPKQGDTVEVGKVLGYLVEAGEAAPFESVGTPEIEASRTKSDTAPPAGPAVRRLARELGVSLNEIPRADKSSRISEADVRSTHAAASTDSVVAVASSTVPQRTRRKSNELLTISPRAARVANELGVDWTSLKGSGKNGRIRERDIRSATASFAAPRQTAQVADVTALSSVRKTIANRMLHSQQQTAAVTLTSTVDATNLVALRTQFKSAPDAMDGLVPSYNDIIAKLVASTLTDHPQLNARSDGDVVELCSSINIGIAVDADAGLIVPVIQDVTSRSLRQVAAESVRLIQTIANRQLGAEELNGGTFTITNLGAFGIDAFTPIINYPECAILGIGRIAKQPTVVGDKIVARESVTLSLTFDHRLVDGAPAAAFLQVLAQRIVNPSPWLMP